MGRHFGVHNITKNHNVSGEWKGNPPSEIEHIIKAFKWDKEDVIISASYDDYCIYDQLNKKWIEGDHFINTFDDDILKKHAIATENSKNIEPKYDGYDSYILLCEEYMACKNRLKEIGEYVDDDYESEDNADDHEKIAKYIADEDEKFAKHIVKFDKCSFMN
jgi:hypothetical protein